VENRFVFSDRIKACVLSIQIGELVGAVIREAEFFYADTGERFDARASRTPTAGDQHVEFGKASLSLCGDEVKVSRSEFLIIGDFV